MEVDGTAKASSSATVRGCRPEIRGCNLGGGDADCNLGCSVYEGRRGEGGRSPSSQEREDSSGCCGEDGDTAGIRLRRKEDDLPGAAPRGDPGGLPNKPCTEDMLIIILWGLMLRAPSRESVGSGSPRGDRGERFASVVELLLRGESNGTCCCCFCCWSSNSMRRRSRTRRALFAILLEENDMVTLLETDRMRSDSTSPAREEGTAAGDGEEDERNRVTRERSNSLFPCPRSSPERSRRTMPTIGFRVPRSNDCPGKSVAGQRAIYV